MSCRDVLAWTAFLAALVGASALLRAQPAALAPAKRAWGFTQSGKYFGFVPAHVKASLAQPVDWNPTGAIGGSEAPFAYQRTPPPRVWAEAEYLLWWTKGVKAPPLVTTSPGSTPIGTAGVLGQPDTQVLFGGRQLHSGMRPGGRFGVGGWLDAGHHVALEANYLFLDEDADSFFATGSDVVVLGRPFFDTSPGTNAQDAQLTAYPGASAGTLGVGSTTRFQTLELLMRRLAWQTDTLTVDGLIGYRCAELQDAIRVDSGSTVLSGATIGSTVVQFDKFATRDTFHGGVLGMALNWRPSAAWSTEFVSKVGLGGTRARTHVTGQTVKTTGGGSVSVSQGGLLTQGTNLGVHNQDDFSVLTEAGLTLRRHFGSGFSTSFGYTLLYWTDVARAGEKIDLNVNATQIPPSSLSGPAQPVFPLNEPGFWAQGMKFGLEYNY